MSFKFHKRNEFQKNQCEHKKMRVKFHFHLLAKIQNKINLGGVK